ncbi:MAG: transcriptional regulator [Planctomycetes bacterium]|nr:transcriptional regulator [Planctomycetota bacterium]
MDSPQIIYVLRWLVRDTFRQSRTTRIFWIMLGFSALCVVFCLGLSVEGGDNLRPDGDFLIDPKTNEPIAGPARDLGTLRLFFGAFRVSLARDRESAVQHVEVILASWVAGAIGLLVTLVWTAGFIPEALQPASATVLFAKPAPRGLFLVGKYLAVTLLVAFQASVFFAGTWLALGLRTGVWSAGYLAGVPLLVVHFAAIYSVSALLAVSTGSTIACALGSILFWALCLAVNLGRDAAIALPVVAPTMPPLSAFTATLIDAAYWILPKPADLVMILERALNADTYMATLSSLPEMAAARTSWSPEASIATAVGFSAITLGYACRMLGKKDY